MCCEIDPVSAKKDQRKRRSIQSSDQDSSIKFFYHSWPNRSWWVYFILSRCLPVISSTALFSTYSSFCCRSTEILPFSLVTSWIVSISFLVFYQAKDVYTGTAIPVKGYFYFLSAVTAWAATITLTQGCKSGLALFQVIEPICIVFLLLPYMERTICS